LKYLPINAVQDIDLNNLNYLVGNKPYSSDSSLRLFYEKTPRRYGFLVGAFDVYNACVKFRQCDFGENINKALDLNTHR
jgi:hypothetical protein